MKIKPHFFRWSFLSGIFLLIAAFFIPSFTPVQAALSDVGTCTDGLFAGGNGTEENPWQVATPTQLANITFCSGIDNANKFFKLTSDINLADFDGSFDDNGWMPIGAYVFETMYSYEAFYGTFNGNHHIIRNLTLNRPQWTQGLFSEMAAGSVVYDLGLESVSITGNSVGGIVGFLSGTVRTSYVSSGTVTTLNEGGLGGIAAEVSNGGIIEDSYVRNVTAIGNSYSTVGGIAGVIGDTARITRVYADAAVSTQQAEMGAVGGIVGGWTNSGSVIEDSFSLSTVTAESGTWFIGNIAGKWGDFTGSDNNYWLTKENNPTNCVGSQMISTENCASVADSASFKDIANHPYGAWSIATTSDSEYAEFNEGFPFLAWQKAGDATETIWLIASTETPAPEPTVTVVTSSGQGSSWGPTGASSALPAPVSTPTPVISDTETCPVDKLLTQDMRAGARNGKYHPYTKAIVKEVKILQAHMNRLGFNSGPEDGILGKLTDGAIKRMQVYLGTTPDGLVGPITRSLINKSCGSNGLQKA